VGAPRRVLSATGRIGLTFWKRLDRLGPTPYFPRSSSGHRPATGEAKLHVPGVGIRIVSELGWITAERDRRSSERQRHAAGVSVDGPWPQVREMDDFVGVDTVGQAELVRRGEVSPVELVEGAIARCVDLGHDVIEAAPAMDTDRFEPHFIALFAAFAD